MAPIIVHGEPVLVLTENIMNDFIYNPHSNPLTDKRGYGLVNKTPHSHAGYLYSQPGDLWCFIKLFKIPSKIKLRN